MKNTDKTIPYKISQAELENLRLLRRRMHSSSSIQKNEEEEKDSGESELWNSDSQSIKKNVEKKIP